MAKPFEHSPSMGSPEAHADLLSSRIEAARETYQRALEKSQDKIVIERGGNDQQVTEAKRILDEAQAEYDAFLHSGTEQHQEAA